MWCEVGSLEQRAPFAPIDKVGHPLTPPEGMGEESQALIPAFTLCRGPWTERTRPLRLTPRVNERAPSRRPSRAFRLETEEWSEGHARIMVPAAGEVDFIAGFKA